MPCEPTWDRMSVLLELGLYQEALDAGQGVLDTPSTARRVRGIPHPPAARHADRARAAESGRLLRVHGPLRRSARGLRRGRGALPGTRRERAGRGGAGQQGRHTPLPRAGQRGTGGARGRRPGLHEAGLTLPYAKALCNIGEANRQLADYRSSLAAFEKARSLYDDLDELTDKSLLMLDTANVYLDLNLYPEALAAYQKVELPATRSAGWRTTARGRCGAWAWRSPPSSNLEEAEQALAEAAELFAAAGNSSLLCGVMLDQSLVQEKRGEPWTPPWRTRGGHWSSSRRRTGPSSACTRTCAWSTCCCPTWARAEPHLIEARLLSERLALPQLRQRLNERLGRLRRLQGNEEEALVALEEAIDEIERLRRHRHPRVDARLRSCWTRSAPTKSC